MHFVLLMPNFVESVADLFKNTIYSKADSELYAKESLSHVYFDTFLHECQGKNI